MPDRARYRTVTEEPLRVHPDLLGRGRTPGKRLLGIRVARLDGRPLSLWTCFNRAGGYGASAATLGLGFLLSRRDPNRQADHDKIVGSVVVRERR